MKQKILKQKWLLLVLAVLLLIPTGFTLAKYAETYDVGTVTLDIQNSANDVPEDDEGISPADLTPDNTELSPTAPETSDPVTEPSAGEIVDPPAGNTTSETDDPETTTAEETTSPE